MGLFSFIGKAVKGVAKVVGGVARVAGGLGLIPGGGLIGKAAGILLAQKRPMGTTQTKLQIGSPGFIRGNVTQGGYSSRGSVAQMWGNRPPPAVLRLSPVMPGGAIAARGGILPRPAGAPPSQFSGGASAPTKRRKRKKASATTKRRRSTRGRKLKFGSPAWRKKYMGKKRRRRAA